MAALALFCIPILIIIQYLLAQEGILFGWKILQPPRGPIHAVTMEEKGEIILEDESRALFTLKSSPSLHWEEIETSSGTGPLGTTSCYGISNTYGAVPPVWNVKNTYSGFCGMPEFGYSYVMIIDGNNNLWFWEKGYTLYVSDVINLILYSAVLLLSIGMVLTGIRMCR